ncbi:equilibrative nucleoside transporter 1 [Anaeramoeba flamelloides]|uniref:Equilibrative nucleoside transporter 1 n=1 Tax=Anaeramoeba flamelloides TaxID=1746091 RepID=A0ABQ8X5C9_9EUKA|nr:equilibrative nucleoside transporter 1 [Anaeramoeba flamelloides]
MGVAHLLPFNVFLTAFDYFNTNLSKVSKSFEFYISNIMTWGTCSSLSFDLFFCSYLENKKRKRNLDKQKQDNKKQKLKFTNRIIGGYIMYILTTGSVPIIMKFCTLKVAFGLIMANVTFVGLSTGICQGGVFGFAAIFEPKYTTAIMSGQGFAGIIVSFLRVITKGATHQTTKGIRNSAFAYFIASSCIVFLITVGYYILINTQFAKYYISKYFYYLQNENCNLIITENEKGDNLKYCSSEIDIGTPTNLSENNFINGEDDNLLPNNTPKEIKLWSLYKKISRFSFTVFFTFFISLTLFPSVMVQIPSTRNHLNTTGWFALILITLFNSVDTFGRTLPRWIPNLFSDNFLVIIVLSRLIFFILFMLCVEKVIFTDSVSIIIIIIFSITNGYPGSISMMRGPFANGVKENERSTAAVIMTLSLQYGLAVGSATSFIFIPLIKALE